MGIEPPSEYVAENAITSFIAVFLLILFASVLLIAVGPDFSKLIDEQILIHDAQTQQPPAGQNDGQQPPAAQTGVFGTLKVSMASQKAHTPEFSEVNISFSGIYALTAKGEKAGIATTAPTHGIFSFEGKPLLVAQGKILQGNYSGLVLQVSKAELVKTDGTKIEVSVPQKEIILEKSFQIIENQDTELGVYFDNYPVLLKNGEYTLDTSLVKVFTLAELMEFLEKMEEEKAEGELAKPKIEQVVFEPATGEPGDTVQVSWRVTSSVSKSVEGTAVYWDLVGSHGENFGEYANASDVLTGRTTDPLFEVSFTLPEVSEETTLFFRVHALVEGENIYSEEKAIVINVEETESPPQQYNGPELWFQHDDYVDMDGDGEPEFAPDMLSRWDNKEQWSNALGRIDYYSLHQNLFKTKGAKDGMWEKFLDLLKNRFGNSDDLELQKQYLRLMLPVLRRHGVKLQIHTTGIDDFVPWEMYGKDEDGSTIVYPQNFEGLERIKQTLDTITSVCRELFNGDCPGMRIKLQSVLSGDWKRGMQNNVYVALEYMKALQEEYPAVEFYIGDALLQRRDYDKSKGWNEAYTALYNAMRTDSRGYSHLNFRGIRIEFDKKWDEPNGFETAEGWTELSTGGGLQLIKSFGWKAGMEFNFPYADDEWGYGEGVLRTAQKSRELNLDWDFVVVHSDEGGGTGHGYPYNVIPENRATNEKPTFSSVFNKVVAFYSS